MKSLENVLWLNTTDKHKLTNSQTRQNNCKMHNQHANQINQHKVNKRKKQNGITKYSVFHSNFVVLLFFAMVCVCACVMREECLCA